MYTTTFTVVRKIHIDDKPYTILLEGQKQYEIQYGMTAMTSDNTA